MLLLGGLTWAGSNIRRSHHSASIRSALNPRIDDLRQHLGINEELPSVDVRFARPRSNERPQFENGRVIVFLRDATASRSENIVKAAMHYVGSSVLPQARPFMDQFTNQALDLTLARRLLQNEQDALRHYTRYFVDDICSVAPQLNNLYGQIVSIDERGLLPGVLLHELSLLSLRLGPAYYHSAAVQTEVVGFIRFLENIATRERSEIGPLDFNIVYIKVKIILLGRDETLDEQGFQPYMRQISRAFLEGFHGAYVLAAGRKAKLVQEFLDGLRENKYFRERISQFEVDEYVISGADRNANRAIGYVGFRRRSNQTVQNDASLVLVEDAQ